MVCCQQLGPGLYEDSLVPQTEQTRCSPPSSRSSFSAATSLAIGNLLTGTDGAGRNPRVQPDIMIAEPEPSVQPEHTDRRSVGHSTVQVSPPASSLARSPRPSFSVAASSWRSMASPYT